MATDNQDPLQNCLTLEELDKKLCQEVPGFADGLEEEKQKLQQLSEQEIADLAASVMVPIPFPPNVSSKII